MLAVLSPRQDVGLKSAREEQMGCTEPSALQNCPSSSYDVGSFLQVAQVILIEAPIPANSALFSLKKSKWKCFFCTKNWAKMVC